MSLSSDWQAFVTWLTNLPPSVKTLVDKLGSDAGQVVKTDAALAAQDITAGGVFNTAAYVKAATDIFAKLPTDSGLLLSDVFAVVNAEVSYLLGQTAS